MTNDQVRQRMAEIRERVDSVLDDVAYIPSDVAYTDTRWLLEQLEQALAREEDWVLNFNIQRHGYALVWRGSPKLEQL